MAKIVNFLFALRFEAFNALWFVPFGLASMKIGLN
jgi:hypothetical protein